MHLVSPEEDFVSRTLAHIPGIFGRLKYVAGLRDADGEYRHWGLIRSYGEKAESVCRAAHEKLLLDILETPVEDLYDEYRQDEFRDFGGEKGLLPEGLPEACQLHFSLVLFALHRLTVASSLETATHRGA